MEAIRYIVDMLLWLLLLAFVLRLMFQLVRADFRDPMADAIVRVTNWLILPLRKVLPPIGKIDTATVIAVHFEAGAPHDSPHRTNRFFHPLGFDRHWCAASVIALNIASYMPDITVNEATHGAANGTLAGAEA